MKGLMVRGTRLIAITKALPEYNKTFRSSYHASFDGARICNICKDSVFYRVLRDVAEAKYQRYVRATRLKGQYPENFQLVEMVSDEAFATTALLEKMTLASRISILPCLWSL